MPSTGGHADRIVIDLEDTVSASKQTEARHSSVEILASNGRRWVRINDTASGYWAADVAAIRAHPHIEELLLSRAENPKQIHETPERFGWGIHFIPLIETARGVERATESPLHAEWSAWRSGAVTTVETPAQPTTFWRSFIQDHDW